MLLSAADRDSDISRLVLGLGRTLVGLVPDFSKLRSVTDDLASACDDAHKEGIWAKMLASEELLRMVGTELLPLNFPPTNVPASVLDDIASSKDGIPERKVAVAFAATKGLEIKVWVFVEDISVMDGVRVVLPGVHFFCCKESAFYCELEVSVGHVHQTSKYFVL